MRRLASLYRDAVADLPRPAWILSFALFVNRAGTMVLPFLALYFTESRAYDVATTGRLVALYGVGAMAGSVLGGLLTERLGAIRTQVLSLVVSGALFLVLPRMPGLASLALALLALSIAAETFRPAVMTSMAECVDPALRPRAFGLLRQAANLGMAIGPAVGGLLAEIDFEWLFVCEAATCWAAVPVLRWAARGLPGRPARPEGTEREQARGASPWRDVPFLLLIALVTLFVTAFFQLWTTVPLYLEGTYRLSKGWIGSLFAFNAVLILLFELPVIRAVERRARMPLVGVGALLICAGLAVLPLGRSLAWAAFSVVVWTAGETLALPMLNVAVAERAGPGRTGAYMGVYMISFSVAFVLAPLVGTLVFDTFGADALWYAIGLLGPFVMGAAWALERPLSAAASD